MTLMMDVRESPEFASLCSFITIFGDELNVNLTHAQLVAFLQTSNRESTPQQWLDIHRKLLNRIKVTCSNDKWESSLKKFVNITLNSETIFPDLYNKDYFSISAQQKAKILNMICDCQFDKNIKFKEKINLKQNKDLRVQPFGSDIFGCLYWLFIDSDLSIIMYKEDLEKESFKIIADSIDDMRNLLVEFENIDCENVDLSKLYIESTTPEDINSPINDSDIIKLDKMVKSEELLKSEEMLKSEDRISCNSVAVEISTEVSVVEINERILPLKLDDVSMENVDIPSNETTNDCSLIVSTIDINETNKELQPTNEEISNLNKEEGVELKLAEKKNRGRKSKYEPSTPIQAVIPDLNSSLRRSERKRKPVNLFNIIYTPLFTNKCKIAKLDNVNIDLKQTESSNDCDHEKLQNPKKIHKRLSGKDSKFNLKKKLNSKIKTNKKNKRTTKHPWEEAESSEEHIEEEEDYYNHEEADISPIFKDEAVWYDKPESDFDANHLSGVSDEETLKLRGKNFCRQKKRFNRMDTDEIIEEDKPCKICLGITLPEMILLCDECDFGHHAMCLRPSLMLIPEGEWFCPKCQHKKLINSLSTKIAELNKCNNNDEAKIRMQERLNFVNISMSNIISSNCNPKHRHDSFKESNTVKQTSSPSYNSSRSDESDESSSSKSSKTEKGRYSFRESSRKENMRYNFKEIDQIFDNALEKDEKYQMMKKRHIQNKESATIEHNSSGIDPGMKVSENEMLNILDEEKPQLRRPSKRKRLSYGSEEDDFEDDVKDQDFKLSSDQSCSEFDDAANNYISEDQNGSDDEWNCDIRKSTKKSHKRKQKKKVLVEFQERPRRSAARKINYLEMLGEDDDDKCVRRSIDSKCRRNTTKLRPVLFRNKLKVIPRKKRKISDSEYEESNNSSMNDYNNDSDSTEKLESVKNNNKIKASLESDTDSERDEKKLIIEEEIENVVDEDEYNVAVKGNDESNSNMNDHRSKFKEDYPICTTLPCRSNNLEDFDVNNEVESRADRFAKSSEMISVTDCVIRDL